MSESTTKKKPPVSKKNAKIIEAVAQNKLMRSQSLVLLLLYNDGNFGWRLGELAKVSKLSAPAVGTAKDNLVANGLAEEQFPARDHRVRKVYLTEKGREEASRLWGILTAFTDMKRSYCEGSGERD